MITDGQHTSVLIVGAGPSGLMMAAQLLRYGIEPVIIDSKQGPTSHSKALIVQARSLEIYRQMGISDKILADGKPARGFAFCEDGEEKVKLDISTIQGVDTTFPFLFVYPQSSNERTLLDYLTLNCCPVYWGTTLTKLSQSGDVATATLQSSGASQSLTADWVIGADGAHSPLRKMLGIPFNGDTYKSLFYLIDCKLTNRVDHDNIRVYLSRHGLTGFFPMNEEGYYRIIGNLPDNLNSGNGDLQLETILPLIKTITGKPIEVTDCRWIITYKLHHRMAENFRQGRCFLIGDAAHIHSPVGGQGMNTGLQDAYNLAWKLALTINKKVGAQILDSYATERMPIAKTLLKSTDRAFKLAISNNFFAKMARQYILPPVISFLWSKENVKTFFFRAVSQISICYRDSKINLHLSQAGKIKAGDRLPDFKIFDEKNQVETDLHSWCAKPGFTFIAMGMLSEEELFRYARWITRAYPELNFFYLPPSNKNRAVFDAFEVAASQTKTLIVRPDMHIGLINDKVDMGIIDNYLKNVVGWKMVSGE